MPANTRLAKELKRLQESCVEGIHVDSDTATTISGGVSVWRAFIEGPSESPYEGGTFELEMRFPKEYPFNPPKVKFLTKMFHPNVYTNGEICLDILQNAWQPTYTAEKTLLSIQSLLTDPNPASSANSGAGDLYVRSKKQYAREARSYTRKHAMSVPMALKRKRERTESESQKRQKQEEEEPPAVQPPEKSPEELLIEEMQEEGLSDTTLLRQLVPIVGGDKDLLRSLYADQKE